MKKRNLFLAIGSIILVGLITAGLFTVKVIKNKKITKVAFYDLPETSIEVIKEILTKDTKVEYNFIILNEKQFLNKNLYKKYDLLFCYNDANTQKLVNQAIQLPDNVAQRIPSTIKNSNFFTYDNNLKIMPVAIDIFEVAYLETTNKRYDIPVPSTIEEIGKFAHTSKYYYVIPLLIAGEVDQNINSLFTLLVQSYGGKEAYFNMIEQLKNTTDFSKIYDYKIGGLADENITVSYLLDILKDWQKNNYFAFNWTTMSLPQTDLFIDDNHIALCFMNLSEHRTKPLPNAKYFKMLDLACGVQPVIVSMGFKDSEQVRIALNRLSLPDSQTLISFKTGFGPSMLQGVSYDIQADDARYIAAATESGPVPDLGTAALSTKEQRSLLAQAIRNYFN